jgi:enamidase
MSTSALVNIGTVLTGNSLAPRADADVLVMRDGKIQYLGDRSGWDLSDVEQVWDVQGMTVTPGLVDSHTHPAIGDWSPRQGTLGWLNSTLHAGVTSTLSMGEARIEEEPGDPAGVKALAILAAKTYRKHRPGGMKVHAGAVWPVSGLSEPDIAEMAANGVWALAEIGAYELPPVDEVLRIVDAARRHGLKVPLHTGGRRRPGTVGIGFELAQQVRPDVACHLSGGPTPAPWADIERVVAETDCYLELCSAGNPRITRDIAALAAERDELHRIMLGSDTPSSLGIIPIAIPRLMSFLASLLGLPAEQIVAMATGNTARAYGLSCGVVEPGRDADVLVLDVPVSSWGTTPAESIELGENLAVSAIFVDGALATSAPRNTQPASRQIKRVR